MIGIIAGINRERIDPLESLRIQLQATGNAIADVDTLTVTAAQWRARPTSWAACGTRTTAAMTIDLLATGREKKMSPSPSR